MNTFRAAMPHWQNGTSKQVGLQNRGKPFIQIDLCQDVSDPILAGCHTGPASHLDFSVLILNSSEEHSTLLVNALRHAGIEATAFQDKRNFLEAVKAHAIQLAVLVLHRRTWWQDELRLFCESIRYIQDPEPEIFCILNWPPKNGQEEALDRVFGDGLRAEVRHEW